MTSERIQLVVDDLTFDAAAEGPAEGAPVLLLHGYPESSWSWRHIQAPLAGAGYRSVAPDLRGYSPGARPAEPTAYAMSTLVSDVVGFADRLGWDTFHLVGHDWGGAAAWHVAGRHPDRLRTLSVVSTPHPRAFLGAKSSSRGSSDDDQAAKSAYMDFFRQPGSEEVLLADGGARFRGALAASGLDAESIDHYYAALSSPEAMVGALNWYRGAQPTDAAGMGPVTTPTLYVWSTNDTALGRTAAEATAAQVEGPYEFVELDGISHWIPEQAPDALVGHLLRHLPSA